MNQDIRPVTLQAAKKKRQKCSVKSIFRMAIDSTQILIIKEKGFSLGFLLHTVNAQNIQ